MNWRTKAGLCLLVVALGLLSFCIPRAAFGYFMSASLAAFAAYYVLCFSEARIDFKSGLALAFIIRIIFIPSFPMLSDDIYRFMWDGLLILEGISPYQYLPSDALAQIDAMKSESSLFALLNSQEYYSVYPPITQAVFTTTALFSGGSISLYAIILKVFILISECLTIWLLIKILDHLNLPRTHALFYGLNPMIVVEGIGNLHFEVFMIPAILLSFYGMMKNKYMLAIGAFSCSIAIKLVSLVLWPFFIPILGFKKWIYYSFLLSVFVLLLFCPLWNIEYLQNYMASIDLYFRKFEFNASLYYVTRYITKAIVGYNIIATAGPILAVCSLGFISFLIWRNRASQKWTTIFQFMLLSFCTYLFTSTTVHPWYVMIPVVLSCFTQLKFALIWSLLILMSYHAYRLPEVDELAWVIIVEYALLALFLTLDLTRGRLFCLKKPN